MATFNMLALLFALVGLCCTAHGEEDLSSRYRFQRMLDSEGRYMLHWSFDLETGIIEFAVNVSTTGWVGFGLSPNGQMPLSDVVIGWVNDQGEAQFHDRFADGRFEPAIDDSQDWFLTASDEGEGRTILEFKRALLTCDDNERDLDITTDTVRIVWSYSVNDPAGITGLAQHTNQGSVSVNLLGGLNEDSQDVEGASFFEIRNDNVVIPNDTDTTYWCTVQRLPDLIRDAESYIFRQSPALTPQDRPYVHHMLAYLCPFITNVDYSGDCDFGVPTDVRTCRNVNVVGGWAIGAEDFIYPNGVSFPIGGPTSLEYVLLEIHYDNPNLTPGVTDSSGFRFYYTSTPPTHKAGLMVVGHDVTRLMIVPPASPTGYTTSGICTPACTSTHFPDDGITVFGSLLHTHLLGRAVSMRHFTQSDPDCDGFKELEPIEQNMQYDFNFQQANIVPERAVLPGDALQVDCFYNSSRPGITVGGERTREEMCLSYIFYYPRIDLSICIGRPSMSSFQVFTDQYFTGNRSDEVLTNLDNRDLQGIEEDLTA